MVAMIRPTLLLKMSLDESEFTEDIAAEIKRSYSYVSPTLVESHETGQYGVENLIKFMVKIRLPYWSSTEEGSDELWNSVMLKWFTNMFSKISATADAYNENRAEKDEQALEFSWVDIEMTENALIALHPEKGTTIPANAAELLDRVRTLANEAAFGENKIACIRIPSRCTLAVHAEAVALAQADATGNARDAESEAFDAAGEATPDLPTLNYEQWGLELEDGSIIEFDASIGTAVS